MRRCLPYFTSLLSLCLTPNTIDAKADACARLLAQGEAIFSRDVYGYFGDQITEDTSSDAAKRIYEKSADYKSKRNELKKLAADLIACRFEYDIALGELAGGGESGTQGVSRIRGFYLFAGVVNEYDIIRNRYQNSRGIVHLDIGENGSAALKRVDHIEPGLLIRFTGLKTAIVGDMQQLPLGYGNAGKHYFELGGLSDAQIFAIERALAGGQGDYQLKLSFQLSPKLYKWVYAPNPLDGDMWHWVVDTKKVEIHLIGAHGKILKTWR